jgi:hypothetical protein
MSNSWTKAHADLCSALLAFRDAGGVEEEALSAAEDVYHEADEHYAPTEPKKGSK